MHTPCGVTRWMPLSDLYCWTLCTHWVPGSVTSLCSAGLLASETPALNPFQPELDQPMICSVPSAHTLQPSGQTPKSKSGYLRWERLQPICEKEAVKRWNTSMCETESLVYSSATQPCAKINYLKSTHTKKIRMQAGNMECTDFLTN